MKEREKEVLDLMKRRNLPDSYEYMMKVEGAHEYIKRVQSTYKKAMEEDDEYTFSRYIEKYSSGWAKIWTLMAIEHFNSRDFVDIDLKYYRHLPEGHSFVMDSPIVGKVKIFPRKPIDPPDCKWATATEIIRMNECPSLLAIVKEFDGAWFNRSVLRTDESIIDDAIKADKERFTMADAEKRAMAADEKVKRQKRADKKKAQEGIFWDE